MPSDSPRFTRDTLEFIQRAARQKRESWLDRHRDEYQAHVIEPMQGFARHLKLSLASVAPRYHFPQRGLGRLKRSAARAAEYGTPFRDYVSYNASRPSGSRFDRNPNLFFLLNPDDEDGDQVLLAGGLYMPSSRQLRSIREAIAADASPFDRLFRSRPFAARFEGGFSDERKSSRVPRGFDPGHARIEWIKLQAYFVWRPYRLSEFASRGFLDLVTTDCAQIVRMNELLERAIEGRWLELSSEAEAYGERRSAGEPRPGLMSRIEDLDPARRKMDF